LLDADIVPINGELGFVTQFFGQPFAATVFRDGRR
jgi:hypothetical protein